MRNIFLVVKDVNYDLPFGVGVEEAGSSRFAYGASLIDPASTMNMEMAGNAETSLPLY